MYILHTLYNIVYTYLIKLHFMFSIKYVIKKYFGKNSKSKIKPMQLLFNLSTRYSCEVVNDLK